jgi:hypothetical protein
MRTRVLLSTLLMAGFLGLGAGVAHAETGYRYWSFWTTDAATWTYAQIGPASTVVSDGDVHGWRFAVSISDGSLAPAPRTDPTRAFQAICGTTPQQPGSARVAVVLDTGTPAIAPDGQQPPTPRGACAVVADGSTGATVLSSVAELRVESGFVCGIDGYPRGECAVAADQRPDPQAEQVDVLTAQATAESGGVETEGATGWPIVIGAALIGLGLGATWLMHHRRVER